ncbi:hypothetical protein ACFT9M_10215 [Micromonospora purpureochromogenes]|uniref:hypothetical protein n=1 Tax=Micromonospora purpureochromogenes TaxID=47872 RepID=UPI0036304D27
MDSRSIVPTTYIRTTPQRLWQALTEPAFTRRYRAAWPRTRLTVTHDDFSPDSEMHRAITSGGRPELLASLKSLRETGEPLAATQRRRARLRHTRPPPHPAAPTVDHSGAA